MNEIDSDKIEEPEYNPKTPLHFQATPPPELYTETLVFSHHNSLFSIFESATIPPFPFLPYQEYVFSSLSPIENDKYLNTSLSTVTKNEKINIIVSRIKTFISEEANVAFKTAFINNTPFYMDTLGIEDTANHLMPALSKIVDECFQLRLQFLKVNKEIIDYLYSQGEKGYYLVLNNEMNIINELFSVNLVDNNKHMQVLLYENYVAIAECLNMKDLGDVILTKIIALSLDSSNRGDIDNLILVVKMVGNLSYKFEKEYNEKFILPQLMMISHNKSELVKIEVCDILPKVAQNVTFEGIRDKVNAILSMFADDGEKTDLLVKISEILCEIMTVYHEKSMYNPKVTNDVYISIFKKMIYVNNKKIRLSAFKTLGKFISLLNFDEVDNSYLTYYTSIIDEYYFNKKDFKVDIDTSLLQPAAFNFPAILYRYGKSQWQSLKNAYINMCKDNEVDVIISLIDSFPEIANILGSEITESELLVIFSSFLNNPNPKINYKAKMNLTKVLKSLSNNTKRKFIVHYKENFGAENDVLKIHLEKVEYEKWRDKIRQGEILECFYGIFSNDVVYEKILPVVVLMCIDDFCEVRKKSAKVFAEIASHLLKSSLYADKVKKIITSFAYCVSFQIRIEFLKICEYLLKDTELYKDFLKGLLQVLSFDRVSHVKIAYTKMIYNIFNKKRNITLKYLLYDEDFLKFCYKIMTDNNIKSIKNKFESMSTGERLQEKITDKKLSIDVLDKEINDNKFYYKFNNDLQVLIDEFDIRLPLSITNHEIDSESKDYVKKLF